MCTWWLWWTLPACVLVLVHAARRRTGWSPRACQVTLHGKTAIVTGANTGIGFRVALDLARRGARVILACRCPVRGAAARDKIRVQTGNEQVLLRILDLSSMASVRDFAQKIHQEEPELHLLVNNAAVTGLPEKITEDGFDMTFATNHIGPVLLTNLLQDLLERSAPSRIVIVASNRHHQGKVDFSHFRGENLVHKGDRVYCHTKLLNVLWSNELARSLQGTGVTVNCVHPGIVVTDVLRHFSLVARTIFNFLGFFFFRSPEEGAVAPLYCAVSEEMSGISGKYIDCDCSLTLPSKTAQDQDLARESYQTCLKLTSNL